MQEQVLKGYQQNKELRDSFNGLATKTFGLNFENWYQIGYWKENYIPYSIVNDGEVVANVSVNKIDCTLNGKVKHYIQLGTVMTKKECRGKGYSRKLFEEIKKDYKNCDGIFLFANDGVLDFYPRFGFEKMDEYRYYADVKNNNECKAIQVPMETKEDWEKFLELKNKMHSNGKLKMNTDGLLMFYLAQFMKENVFYIKSLDAYVIAEEENGTLTIYDVYSKEPVSMLAVVSAFGGKITKVMFNFTPENTDNLVRYKYKEEDNTYFVLGNELKHDMKEILSFPEIVHA